MTGGFAAIPPLASTVTLTVAIPARNEEASIGPALRALAQQRQRDGAPFAYTRYDVIVFANDCDDATVARAREVAGAHTGFALHVVAGALPPRDAHVGTARKAVMDVAARRFFEAGRPRGTVATTDADTIVDAGWIAETVAEAGEADAVMGRILLAPGERERLSAQMRRLYLRDMAYRRVVAELEALRDPVACDPLPRHGQHYGASFAVSAGAYARAGGVPPRPVLEDLAFFQALQRIDARVRHSTRVRVATSARTLARVEGGFATFLRDLHACAERRDEPLVEPAGLTRAHRCTCGVATAVAGRCATGGSRSRDRHVCAVARPVPAALRAVGSVRSECRASRSVRVSYVRGRPPGTNDRGARGAALRARGLEGRPSDARDRSIGCRLTQIHLEIAHETHEWKRFL